MCSARCLRKHHNKYTPACRRNLALGCIRGWRVSLPAAAPSETQLLEMMINLVFCCWFSFQLLHARLAQTVVALLARAMQQLTADVADAPPTHQAS